MSLTTLNIPPSERGGQFYVQLSMVGTTLASKSFAGPGGLCTSQRERKTEERVLINGGLDEV